MARGFRRRGRGPTLRYAARLDRLERSVIIGLMEQVIELLDPPEAPAALEECGARADDFEGIVAGLGALGMGVSLSAADHVADDVPVPADARSFGERDPALQRLLPSANRQDDQVSAEFRRLTEAGLRRRKANNLEAAIRALSHDTHPVEVDAAGAQAMLVALTDVRLVLGERLGLRTDPDVERIESTLSQRSDDDPVLHAFAVYDFLTWLQETLAAALLTDLGPQDQH